VDYELRLERGGADGGVPATVDGEPVDDGQVVEVGGEDVVAGAEPDDEFGRKRLGLGNVWPDQYGAV
jgi:hypothetical protein